MPFPYHDMYWCQTADFVQKNMYSRHETIVAPEVFGERFVKIYPYRVTRLDPGFLYQWIIIHKGLLNDINPEFIRNNFNKLTVVFANEVFVVFSKRPDLARVSSDSPHVLSLMEKVGNLRQENAFSGPKNSVSPGPYLGQGRPELGRHFQDFNSPLAGSEACTSNPKGG